MNQKHASIIHRMLLLSNLAINGDESARVAMRNAMEKHSAYKAALCLLATSMTLEYAAGKLIDYMDENTLEDGSNPELDKKLSGWANKLQAILQELSVFIEPESGDSPSPLDMNWLVGE